MTATKAYLYLNSMLLQLRGLRNDRTAALVTSGHTITADLAPTAGGAAISQSPITLTYDGVDGNWSGVYPANVVVAVGDRITARVTIDGGSPTASGYIEIDCDVRKRKVV